MRIHSRQFASDAFSPPPPGRLHGMAAVPLSPVVKHRSRGLPLPDDEVQKTVTYIDKLAEGQEVALRHNHTPLTHHISQMVMLMLCWPILIVFWKRATKFTFAFGTRCCKACCLHERFDLALDVYYPMLAQFGVRPNTYTYLSIINGLGACQRLRARRRLCLHAAQCSKIAITDAFYRSIMSTAAAAAIWPAFPSSARDLIGDKVTMTEATAFLAVREFSRAHMIDELRTVMAYYYDCGGQLTVDMTFPVIRAEYEAGNVNEARTILSSLSASFSRRNSSQCSSFRSSTSTAPSRSGPSSSSSSTSTPTTRASSPSSPPIFTASATIGLALDAIERGATVGLVFDSFCRAARRHVSV
jgi:hypothetical protein